jgi:hypothetical protein
MPSPLFEPLLEAPELEHPTAAAAASTLRLDTPLKGVLLPPPEVQRPCSH